jgi:hypothetical protein
MAKRKKERDHIFLAKKERSAEQIDLVINKHPKV